MIKILAIITVIASIGDAILIVITKKEYPTWQINTACWASIFILEVAK